MTKLTCRDIKERQKNLVTDSYVSTTRHNVKYLFENLDTKYSINSVKVILENWRELSGTEIESFDKVLEVFGLVCKHDNESSIRYVANIIEGNIIHKVRDGRATRHLNNYKLGKFKIQNTKAQNRNNDNNDAVNLAMKNKGSLPNTLHPNRKYKRDIYGNKIGTAVQNKSSEEESTAKDKAVEEAFALFENATWCNDQCDRVIKNHTALIRKFDMESKVRSCSINEESLQECIYGLCELIDTYDIAFGVKYNIALENILYLMSKNCVKVTDRFIMESVTDYFLLTRDTSENDLRDIEYILSNSKFYTNEDVDYMRQLFSELDLDDTDSDSLDKIIHEATNKDEIKKILNQFKKSNKKTIEGLKSCITRIFVKPPEMIISELPDIFGVIRTCAILGLFLINPIIGVIGTITGMFLKMHLNRQEMKKVIDQYYNEKRKYTKKMKEAKDDKTKDKYKKLIEKLDSDITKLEDYEDDLYTDEANDKRREERYAKQAEFDDDDDFLGNFELDFNFDESYQIQMVEMMATLFESATYNTSDLMNTIKNNIEQASGNDIYQLTESVVLCNDIFDCPAYLGILEDTLLATRLIPGLQKYEKIDSIHMAMSNVKKIKYDNLIEEAVIDAPIDVLYEHLRYQIEVVDDTLEYFTRRNIISEGSGVKSNDKGLSFMSKLKIAKENLRRTSLKLKDKDRELSRKLDNNIELFSKNAKNAMVSDNREAIIKGRLLPSASKCIHLAVATGLAWLVSPAIAVVGVLGYIGMSKHLQEKERRLIFDEIEVEIEMCDKYLRLAEDKNDMKAVRNIMQTKRSLERQRQRLRNGMGVAEFKKLKNPYDPRSGTED